MTPENFFRNTVLKDKIICEHNGTTWYHDDNGGCVADCHKPNWYPILRTWLGGKPVGGS